MASTTMPVTTRKSETFFERHAWKVLFGVSLILGFFGVGDMQSGASNLQNGETVMMHGLTDMSWNELQAANPNAAHLIDTIFRMNGATLAVLAALSAVICVMGFRRGQRWAWYALWALPAWMALTVFFVFNAVKHPRHGTPVPVISGSVLFVVCAAALALSYRKFFKKQ
jgi:hypothetical protein